MTPKETYSLLIRMLLILIQCIASIFFITKLLHYLHQSRVSSMASYSLPKYWKVGEDKKREDYRPNRTTENWRKQPSSFLKDSLIRMSEVSDSFARTQTKPNKENQSKLNLSNCKQTLFVYQRKYSELQQKYALLMQQTSTHNFLYQKNKNIIAQLKDRHFSNQNTLQKLRNEVLKRYQKNTVNQSYTHLSQKKENLASKPRYSAQNSRIVYKHDSWHSKDIENQENGKNGYSKSLQKIPINYQYRQTEYTNKKNKIQPQRAHSYALKKQYQKNLLTEQKSINILNSSKGLLQYRKEMNLQKTMSRDQYNFKKKQQINNVQYYRTRNFIKDNEIDRKKHQSKSQNNISISRISSDKKIESKTSLHCNEEKSWNKQFLNQSRRDNIRNNTKDNIKDSRILKKSKCTDLTKKSVAQAYAKFRFQPTVGIQ